MARAGDRASGPEADPRAAGAASPRAPTRPARAGRGTRCSTLHEPRWGRCGTGSARRPRISPAAAGQSRRAPARARPARPGRARPRRAASASRGQVAAVQHGHDLAGRPRRRAGSAGTPADSRSGSPCRTRKQVGRILRHVGAQPAAGGGDHPRARSPVAPAAAASQQPVAKRRRGRAQQRVHLGSDAAGADEHQPLGPFRELVGELHRHPAAERVADHGYPVDVEHAEQVAHPVGVPGDGVVRSRLVDPPWPSRSGAMTVWSGRAAASRPARLRAVADAVDEQEGRAAAGHPVRPPVAVDPVERRPARPRRRVAARSGGSDTDGTRMSHPGAPARANRPRNVTRLYLGRAMGRRMTSRGGDEAAGIWRRHRAPAGRRGVRRGRRRPSGRPAERLAAEVPGIRPAALRRDRPGVRRRAGGDLPDVSRAGQQRRRRASESTRSNGRIPMTGNGCTTSTCSASCG